MAFGKVLASGGQERTCQMHVVCPRLGLPAWCASAPRSTTAANARGCVYQRGIPAWSVPAMQGRTVKKQVSWDILSDNTVTSSSIFLVLVTKIRSIGT